MAESGDGPPNALDELEAILGMPNSPPGRPTGPQPFMLNYRAGGWPTGFLDEWCGDTRPPGTHCDEYPFAATYQGGVEPPTYDASAKVVPAHDNRVQGGKYGAFLSTCNLKRLAPSPPVPGLQPLPTNPARIPTTPPFLVIPAPFVAETATTTLCNDGIARP